MLRPIIVRWCNRGFDTRSRCPEKKCSIFKRKNTWASQFPARRIGGVTIITVIIEYIDIGLLLCWPTQLSPRTLNNCPLRLPASTQFVIYYIDQRFLNLFYGLQMKPLTGRWWTRVFRRRLDRLQQFNRSLLNEFSRWSFIRTIILNGVVMHVLYFVPV